MDKHEIRKFLLLVFQDIHHDGVYSEYKSVPLCKVSRLRSFVCCVVDVDVEVGVACGGLKIEIDPRRSSTQKLVREQKTSSRAIVT
jgi:hypothetical protein